MTKSEFVTKFYSIFEKKDEKEQLVTLIYVIARLIYVLYTGLRISENQVNYILGDRKE